MKKLRPEIARERMVEFGVLRSIAYIAHETRVYARAHDRARLRHGLARQRDCGRQQRRAMGIACAISDAAGQPCDRQFSQILTL